MSFREILRALNEDDGSSTTARAILETSKGLVRAVVHNRNVLSAHSPSINALTDSIPKPKDRKIK